MPLTSIRILYVDDDEDDFILVKSLLQKITRTKYTVDRASSFSETIEQLVNDYNAFLVDYSLGKENGLVVLEAIKRKSKYAPVIMLTGMENLEIDRQAMKAGAADYLVKGNFNSDVLDRTIRYAIRDALSLQAIEVNTNRFRNIFERAADPIILTDKEGWIIKVNPSFVNSFHYNPENDDQKLSIFSLVSNDDHIRKIKKTLETSIELNDLEVSFKLNDNRTIEALISVVLHDSQADWFQVMIKDLTSLRIKQEEDRHLRRFYSTGRIAGILAHEVKNPLTNITLAADQLRMELPDTILKESGDLLDIVNRNCGRINQLITELLYSTRFSELKIDKHSINTIVEDALELAADRINFKKVKVIKNFAEDICDIEIDTEKIKIAFLNIIVNAVEAINHPNGILSIHTYTKENKCIVEITDNGSGISTEHLEHLFEPFFTNKENGTGLGLANAQSIILSHKGSIRVKSELNRGTTFIVTLNMSSS